MDPFGRARARGFVVRRGVLPRELDRLIGIHALRNAIKARARSLWQRVRDTFRVANTVRYLATVGTVGGRRDAVGNLINFNPANSAYTRYGRDVENTIADQVRNLWMDDAFPEAGQLHASPGYGFNIRRRRARPRYRPY